MIRQTRSRAREAVGEKNDALWDEHASDRERGTHTGMRSLSLSKPGTGVFGPVLRRWTGPEMEG